MCFVSVLVCSYQFILAYPLCTATHFRFGTISWKILDQTKPNQVQFYSSFTFRRSFFGTPNVGSTINPGTFTFGDGSAAVQLYLLISSIDTVNDWASGTFTNNHTYPATVAKNYTAGHTSAVCTFSHTLCFFSFRTRIC
jgi:hypothetical protein